MNMRRTKKGIKRILILLLVFCGAVAGILFFMNREDETEVSYAASGPASLPVVYMEVEGEQVNGLHGYHQRYGNPSAGRQTAADYHRGCTG